MAAGPWESWGRLRGPEQKLLEEAKDKGESLGLEACRRRKRRGREWRDEGAGMEGGGLRSLEILLRKGNLEDIADNSANR